MWGVILSIFVVQLVAAILLKYAAQKTNKPVDQTGDPLAGLSVLIPFHNEENRIQPLIAAINHSDFPKTIELIFVNDHSTDQTAVILTSELKKPYQLIENQKRKGKKWALLSGVENANYDYILTLDADCCFQANYFKNALQLPKADLIILPVELTTHSFFARLGSIEFYFLNTLGFGMAHFESSVLCYGANLFFRRSSFLEVESSRTDYEIPSGDDLFLLAAMQKHQKDIKAIRHKSLQVETPAAAKFKTIIQQRQRWFAKMSSLLTATSFLPLLLLIVTQFCGVFCLFYGFFKPEFFMLLIVKFMAEAIAASDFIRRKFSHIIYLVMHQLWYPLFNILLLIPVKKEKRWL